MAVKIPVGWVTNPELSSQPWQISFWSERLLGCLYTWFVTSSKPSRVIFQDLLTVHMAILAVGSLQGLRDTKTEYKKLLLNAPTVPSLKLALELGKAMAPFTHSELIKTFMVRKFQNKPEIKAAKSEIASHWPSTRLMISMTLRSQSAIFVRYSIKNNGWIWYK